MVEIPLIPKSLNLPTNNENENANSPTPSKKVDLSAKDALSDAGIVS